MSELLFVELKNFILFFSKTCILIILFTKVFDYLLNDKMERYLKRMEEEMEKNVVRLWQLEKSAAKNYISTSSKEDFEEIKTWISERENQIKD